MAAILIMLNHHIKIFDIPELIGSQVEVFVVHGEVVHDMWIFITGLGEWLVEH